VQAKKWDEIFNKKLIHLIDYTTDRCFLKDGTIYTRQNVYADPYVISPSVIAEEEAAAAWVRGHY